MGVKDWLEVGDRLKRLFDRRGRAEKWAKEEADTEVQVLEWLYVLRDYYRSLPADAYRDPGTPDRRVLEAKINLKRLRLWDEHRARGGALGPGGRRLSRQEENAAFMQTFIDFVERWGWREARRQIGRPRQKEDFRLASRFHQILDRLEELPVISGLLKNRRVSLLDRRYWDQRYAPRGDIIDERRDRWFSSIGERDRDQEGGS